jgi:hypothetical protein
MNFVCRIGVAAAFSPPRVVHRDQANLSPRPGCAHLRGCVEATIAADSSAAVLVCSNIVASFVANIVANIVEG